MDTQPPAPRLDPSNPIPDIAEPCPWCQAPASLVRHGGHEILRCAACLVVVEIAATAGRSRRRAALEPIPARAPAAA